MQQKTNKNVLELMDTFLKPIRLEKQAADEINEIKHTNGAAPVTPEEEKGDGTAQGAFGKEKQKDIKDSEVMAIAADSPAATNEAGGSDKPIDDQGTKSLGSDQAVSQPSVTVNKTTDPQEDNSVNDKGQTGGHDKMAKMKRNAYLAQNINALKAQGQEKEAAAAPQISEEDQLFLAAFQRGMEKRAEDEAELVEAGMAPEEAEASLDAVAEANPVAVLPEEAEAAPELPPEVLEAAAAGGEEMPPEAMGGEEGGGEPAPEELAAALDEAGVTPEELAEAVATVEELGNAGVAPEEIIAAVQTATGEAPVPEEKVAAQRMGVIANHLGLLKQNR